MRLKSEKNSKNSNLMTEGNIFKILVLFSIPLILGNLLQQMYNTVDSIIVGNYVGSNALAAVGSSTSLIYLLIAFSQGASVGAGVVIAQAVGAKDDEGVSMAVHTSIFIAAILGLALSILGFLFSSNILLWMQTPQEVFEQSSIYLKLYSLGMVFNVVYNMLAGILNAVGNSKRSLLYLAIASITNIILDLLFIKVFQLGVVGAAVATDISQLVSCVFALLFLIRVSANYSVKLKAIKLHKKYATRIVKLGLPTGIHNMVISLSNILVQSSVNVFGATVIAGFGAYMKIDGFNVLPVLSLSMAITTFTGQNYGAGKMERVKKGMWITLLISFIYTVITGLLLLKFSHFVMGLFTNDNAVINSGILAMKFFCPFYAMLGILQCFAGTIRGFGKTIPPMVVLLISLCGFRIVWVKFIIPLYNTIEMVYVLYPISWAIGTVLIILYMFRANLLGGKKWSIQC